MQTQVNKKLDFSGQNIYVGLDTHKKQITVTIMGEHLHHKTFSQPPDAGVLVKYLNKNFPGANYYAAYEAGYSGFWLQENLQAHRINCVVVHAADVPTKDKERKQKRDPLDSQKIARSLKSGELEAIYIPSKDCQQDSSLLRARHQIVATKRDAETGSGITEFFWNQLPSAKSFSISVIKIKTCIPINDLSWFINFEEFPKLITY